MPDVLLSRLPGGLRVSPLELISLDSIAHGLDSWESLSAPQTLYSYFRCSFSRLLCVGAGQSRAVEKLCEERMGRHRKCMQAESDSQGGGHGKL